MDPRLAAQLFAAETSDEEYVDTMFALVLRRPAEAEARERALAKLGEGTLSRATLVHELVTSEEAERTRVLDDAIALARGARLRDERPRWLQGPRDTDERVIEIPWVLARIRGKEALEVGYAFAEASYLAALLDIGFERLVGVDLADADVPGLESVRADVRTLPFERGVFEVVLLVSTLEHIGADNSRYEVDGAKGESARFDALRELRRVLSPSGRMLVTVPCGEPEDYGWFKQEDVRGWTRLFTRSGFFIEELEVYELGDDGWRSTSDFEPTGVRYGERGPAAAAVLCVELSPRRLRRYASLDGLRRTARRRAPRSLRRKRLPRSG